MATKICWANICCDDKMQPYLLIVTDGEWSSHIPVTNCRLETVQRTARDVYGVPKRRQLVTQIIGDVGKDEGQ